MTIFVCRHGRTEANASGLLLGRADPGLDATGRVQAERIAAALPEGIRVVSSPLRRCRETAAAVADGAEVVVDDRLVELDYGDFDLVPMAEIPGEQMAAWRADPHFRPPNGETLVELAERVGAFLDELAADVDGGDVAVVTHVSPIKAAMAWALGVEIGISWRSHVAQASITCIEIGRRGPSLHGFNLVDHLRPA